LLVDINQNQMPYPAYSIVVVEETTNNVTSLRTEIFKTVGEAKVAYKDAVDAGKRAFLYEKPQPSSFRRKDSQPFAS
jgi:hypothetical protein